MSKFRIEVELDPEAWDLRGELGRAFQWAQDRLLDAATDEGCDASSGWVIVDESRVGTWGFER